MRKYQLSAIGADPEFFLSKDGKPYPVVGILGGDKDNPTEVEKFGWGYGFLEDNVMPEFNIAPCTSKEEFIQANTQMIEHIMSVLPAELHLKADFSPARRFEEKYLESEQAKVFGCMPDTNAYTLDTQQVCAEDAGNLRTAGGHIHISWEDSTGQVTDGAPIARAFDLFCTLPMMILEPDNERRQLYGKAGSMRAKWYGVECRQLSCFWLSSPKLMGWVYDQTVKAVEFCNTNEDIHNPESELCKSVRAAIDNKDKAAIDALVIKHNVDSEIVGALKALQA